MGRVREQPQSEVLFHNAARSEATRERNGKLGEDIRRHRSRTATRNRDRMTIGRIRNLWARVRRSLRDEPRDQDFVIEMEEHVRLLAERFRTQGMTSQGAEVAARRQFGNTLLLEEDRRTI